MAQIITFPGCKKAAATKKPAGSLDIISEQHGMVLLDGCIPAELLPEILRLMETAGVRVHNNAA